MAFRPDEVKGELLRVRREIAVLDSMLEKAYRDLEKAAETGDRDHLEDARGVRQCLWKDKEQLRIQETIFLRIIFGDPLASPVPQHIPATPPVLAVEGSPVISHGEPLLPGQPRQSPYEGKRIIKSKIRRNKLQSPGMPSMDPNQEIHVSGFEANYVNPGGYDVNRSSDCRVRDVWNEWKMGLNGGPAVERLEEERKRDRKLVWWKSMNDYKYWSKQMRVIHAIEQKAQEFGGDIEASIEFWEDILKNEFEGSVSKLREALGGQKSNEEDLGSFKRRCKELLHRGLERMKHNDVDQSSHGDATSAPMM